MDYLSIYKLAQLFLKISKPVGLVNSLSEAARILGVHENADKQEIEKAYRRKAVQYHPDKNRGKDTTRLMQEINEAKEFFLNYLDNPAPLQTEEYIEDPTEDPTYPSWEQVAEEYKQDRDAWNKKYNKYEVQGEIGLDAWNSMFEGYDPNFEPGPEQWAREDQIYDYIFDSLYDEIDIDSVISFWFENKDLRSFTKEKIKKFIEKRDVNELKDIIDLSDYNDTKKMLLNKFREETIKKVEDSLIEKEIEKLIKEDLLLKIIPPDEILSGGIFNYSLVFKILMNMPEEKFMELIDRIKNSPNKFIEKTNSWGEKSKLIDFSVAFSGPNAEKLGGVLENVAKHKSAKDGGRIWFYHQYIKND